MCSSVLVYWVRGWVKWGWQVSKLCWAAAAASSSLSLSQCQCHCPFTDKNPLPLVTGSHWTPFAILAMFYLTNSKLLEIKHAHRTKFQWIFITAAVVRNVACSKVKRQMYTGWLANPWINFDVFAFAIVSVKTPVILLSAISLSYWHFSSGDQGNVAWIFYCSTGLK